MAQCDPLWLKKDLSMTAQFDIAIVGAGFSGTALTIQLLKKSAHPIRVLLCESQNQAGPGHAYNPYSSSHLLNVPAGKMSLYPAQPGHFTDWLLTQPEHQQDYPPLLAQAFVPRFMYGRYLQQQLQQANQQNQAKLELVHQHIQQIRPTATGYRLSSAEQHFDCKQLVLACGNALPATPSFVDLSALRSPYYSANPWKNPTLNPASAAPVLIIGNGLSMVDTVLALKQQGCQQPILSLSPHGFQILPHRHPGLAYPLFQQELATRPDWSLRQLVTAFNQHRKAIRRLGVSAEPLVDSLRPLTQSLWRRFSNKEKRQFMRRLRHLWGVARHRLPLHIHDQLRCWQLTGELQVLAGRVATLGWQGHEFTGHYLDKTGQSHPLHVSAVINCTGPDPDIRHATGSCLLDLLQQGLLCQDELKLGIQADAGTGQVRNGQGQLQPNLYALGPLLRGELWESTAVNELRVQASQLAEHLLSVSS